jgi:hypothetical protein
MEFKTSHLVKIAAAVGIAAVVIMQALQSNESGKIEKISDAILTMEKKVSAELEAVEKEQEREKVNAALPIISPSPSPSASASPSASVR